MMSPISEKNDTLEHSTHKKFSGSKPSNFMPEEERKLTGSGFYDVAKFEAEYGHENYSDDFEEVITNHIIIIVYDYSMKVIITKKLR
jgi:hypothetical protein